MSIRFVFAFFALTILSSCAFIQEIYEPRDLLQTVRQLRDYDGPVVTVLEPANNQEVGTVYIFQGSVVDRGVKNETTGVDAVYVQSDSEAYRKVVPNNGVWSVTVTNSAEGYHTNRVFSLDKRGNASETNRIVVLVQASMPYLTVTAPASGVLTNRDYMMITGNAGIGKPYSIDKIVVSSAESGSEEAFYIPKNNGWKCIYTLKDGTNDLTVRVIADSGKTNALHWKLFLDRYAPTLAIESPIENSDVGSSYVLSGTVADNFSGVKSVFVAVDASPYRRLTLSNGRFQTNILIPSLFGVHTNKFILIDYANNYISNKQFVNRKAIPVLTCILPSGFYTNQSTVDISGSATVDLPDSLLFVAIETNKVFYNVTGINSEKWSIVVNLKNGTNKLRISTTSQIGQKTTLISNTIYVDTQKPTCLIGSIPMKTNLSSFTINGSASDNFGFEGIYVSVSKTGNNFRKIGNSTGWSTNLVGLTSGYYTNKCFALDKARNVSTTNTRVVFVDAVSPTVTPSALPALIETPNYTFSGTATDDFALEGVYVSIGKTNESFKKQSGSVNWSTNLTSMKRGLYTVKVFSKDLWGNISPTNVQTVRFGWWETVGGVAASDGSAEYLSLAIATNGLPFLAFRDNFAGSKATVINFNGIAWTNIGIKGFTGGTAYHVSLILSKSGPYIAYRDLGINRAYAMKYDGSSWVYVGTNFSTSSESHHYSIQFDKYNNPIVGYNESSYCIVKKYTNATWITEFTCDSYGSGLAYPDLLMDKSGNGYFVFADTFVNGIKAKMYYYNGIDWSLLGGTFISTGNAFYMSLAVDTNEIPYVAYEDGNPGRISVKKYNGTTWVNVGNLQFSSGNASEISIAISESGSPYVIYVDSSIGGGQAIVKQFNGSSWVSVGSQPVSIGTAVSCQIKAYKNKLYIAFSDSGNASKAIVKMWEW